MPYEIPQNLKYKEKIAFGLTFWQLIWISLFGGTAAIIFFKTKLLFELKFFLALFLAVLGVGFAFLDFFEHIKNIHSYKKQKKEMGFFDSKMKKFLDVKKIEDNTIYLANGSIRSVIEVLPINFNMLSSSEQKAVISAYKDFLNSLDFPIQVVVRTVNLSLEEYLTKLEEKVKEEKNENLTKEMDSFREFIREFIESNTVKNRLFYIVIPFSASNKVNPIEDLMINARNFFSKNKKQTGFELNKETALNQLEIRTELCQEKLKRCNLMAKKLNTEELVSLLASFFEGFVETKNNYISLLTLAEKLEEKRKQETFVDLNGTELPKKFLREK